jgi:hypothetical protein
MSQRPSCLAVGFETAEFMGALELVPVRYVESEGLVPRIA